MMFHMLSISSLMLMRSTALDIKKKTKIFSEKSFVFLYRLFYCHPIALNDAQQA